MAAGTANGIVITDKTPVAQANRALANTQADKEKAEKAKANLKNEIKELGREAGASAIVVGTAFGCGYLTGRYGDNSEVFGLPLGATVAVGGLAAVAFKVGSKSTRPYLVSLATGGAAAVAASLGHEMGKEDAEAPVAGVGEGRSSRRSRRSQQRNRREEEDDIPPDLPPGLRGMYERRKREQQFNRL